MGSISRISTIGLKFYSGKCGEAAGYSSLYTIITHNDTAGFHLHRMEGNILL